MHPTPPRPFVGEAILAVVGLHVATCWIATLVAAEHTSSSAWGAIFLLTAAMGCAAAQVPQFLGVNPRPTVFATVALVPAIPWATGAVLLTPVPVLLPVSFAAGVALATAVTVMQPRPWRVLTTATGCSLMIAGSAATAGAWSVDEPPASDPRMVAGNGIVLTRDTHAFLLAQGVTILDQDGHTAIADFLNSPDPTAPLRRDPATGRTLGERESYLWRMQRASRDADRTNKSQMPDHFFNWWTHSGKGLIAGPSAATSAEEQHDQATAAWQRGDRSQAMNHLGAATHLVEDACTPPHATAFVPQHRSYEEWVVGQQDQMKANAGGIYQNQFRVKTGHGGADWSSSHTRGWLDECAHRAADQIANTIQPPSDDTILNESAAKSTDDHFRQTQQMTAGYLKFFFDEVGGP